MPYSRIEDLLLVGDRASQPAANTVSVGTLYSVDDEGFLIEQSDGASWNQWGPSGAVAVDAAGALDGDGSIGSPLAVRPDGITVQINGSNELEVIPGGANVLPFINNYRLSATTAVPVTTSDVTTTSTLYWTPYNGLHCSLYTGAAWSDYTGGELSLALSSLTSDKNYDVFVDYNGGTEQLVLVAWTDDTTRATALTKQDGVYVLTAATDHRYVGTIRTIATNATCDFGGGSTTNVGGKRFIWNYYNRVERALAVIETEDTWVYSTATTRQARAIAGNKVEMVVGVSEEPITASVLALTITQSGGSAYVGVGLDTTSAFTGPRFAKISFNDALFTMVVDNTFYTGIGYHYVSWNERGQGSGTTNWYGDAGETAGLVQSGLRVVIRG
jgi:hypothetical protein